MTFKNFVKFLSFSFLEKPFKFENKGNFMFL